jgi:two-component system NtrC family sensor kinase
VPSRWRIRHKLLLGVALVIAVMALLLGGTLRGLWSYYVTTNNIRAKLHELSAAEDLNAAVVNVVSRENIGEMRNNSSERFRTALKSVQAALDAYADQLDDTLANGRDPHHGIYEKAQVECLRKDLDAFRDAVAKRLAGHSMISGGTNALLDQDMVALDDPMTALKRDAADLRNAIKVQLNDRLSESRRHYQIALWIIVPSSVVGLLVMLGLMRSFYAWVFNPIRDLEKGVSSLAQGRFAHVIEINSGDEMQDLAVAFNDMARRLGELYGDLANQVNERSRQLVRSERLASVGFLAAGVAHEINNPLASIAFCSEALEARLDELFRTARPAPRMQEEHEIFGKYLRMIQEEAFRCKSITERLLEFSRTGEPRREATELRGLVQAVLDVTQHLPNHKGKRIVFEVPPERAGGRITAWVNGEEIKSVILNLVVNALENMDEDGTLTIRLAQRDGLAELRFIDTGCGMTAEVLENVFEPFFTRSRSGKGTGLGLTISHLIISQHGGQIEASSAGAGQGSTFSVRLPVQPTEAVAEVTVGQAAPVVVGPRLAA